MPKFAANLTFLFTELPFIDRFAAAKEAGFDAVEVLFPYDHSVPEVSAALRINELELVLINTPPPNWTGGDRGYAAIPGGEDRFRYDFRRAMRVAKSLRPRHLHVMAGRAKGAVARSAFINNLRWACDEAPGQSLTIEPINQTDIAGYYLSDFDLAAQIIAEVDRPNLGLQFDAYHAQMITGTMEEVWQVHGPAARHIQIAGVPGRHEPAGGDIDYPAFFARLDADGYAGFVSAEYKPRGETGDGLGWLPGAPQAS